MLERLDSLQENLMKIVNEKRISDKRIETERPLSYAETTASHLPLEKSSQEQLSVESFQSIMTATRNAEIAEQKDREERACNIILHGREENVNSKNDVLFLDEFLEEVRGKPQSIKLLKRIGKAESKIRPIMISFHNEQDKQKTMMNLRNLKGNKYFKEISVTEDYTVYERQIMKEYRKAAREKNSLEPEDSKFVWKTKGNPRNGLVLKRFVKVLESET